MKTLWKGLIFCLIIAFCFPPFVLAGTDPFQEAKQISMTSQPDTDGNYWKEVRGSGIVYMVGYVPSDRSIGVMVIDTKTELILVVIYNENNRTYLAAASVGEKGKVEKKLISKEQADEFASEVLKMFWNAL